MRKFVILLALSFVFSGFANAQVVKIDKMPTTVADFLDLRDKIAQTPEGGATMFIIALKLYVENPTVGEQCLVIAIDRSRIEAGTVYKGFALYKNDKYRLDRQMKQYPYVPNSYFKGANPDNGYNFKFPTQMDYSSNTYSGDKNAGDFKVFVKCYGADSSRPIRLIKNDKGFWKAKEWSSIIMGIRKPVEDVDDDL